MREAAGSEFVEPLTGQFGQSFGLPGQVAPQQGGRPDDHHEGEQGRHDDGGGPTDPSGQAPTHRIGDERERGCEEDEPDRVREPNHDDEHHDHRRRDDGQPKRLDGGAAPPRSVDCAWLDVRHADRVALNG
jgi:hypothetical protein